MAYSNDEQTGSTPPPTTVEQVAKQCARDKRALKTLSAGNRTLLRASEEQELVHEMCRVIVETGGYSVAAVAYAEHDTGKNVRWIAAAGTEIDVLEAFHFTWDDSEWGGTLVGAAIRTGQPIVGKHATDAAYAGPAYAATREYVVQHGFASATAFPLRLEGECCG